jgi:hypothetical protein
VNSDFSSESESLGTTTRKPVSCLVDIGDIMQASHIVQKACASSAGVAFEVKSDSEEDETP